MSEGSVKVQGMCGLCVLTYVVGRFAGKFGDKVVLWIGGVPFLPLRVLLELAVEVMALGVGAVMMGFTAVDEEGVVHLLDGEGRRICEECLKGLSEKEKELMGRLLWFVAGARESETE